MLIRSNLSRTVIPSWIFIRRKTTQYRYANNVSKIHCYYLNNHINFKVGGNYHHGTLSLPECLHGLLPGPFLLRYYRCLFLVSPYFFVSVPCPIKLAISSPFELTEIYRIVSYRIWPNKYKSTCIEPDRGFVTAQIIA